MRADSPGINISLNNNIFCRCLFLSGRKNVIENNNIKLFNFLFFKDTQQSLVVTQQWTSIQT